ncbi:hypothetical protein CY0110_16932 [Crocosphaera chwakensis CCY0110]|uniref:Uncharacterized protein n=1 Tax=Crocosphaera chwakensis CCY0110 TaxID=391612 RepID=A3II68_9CHRO|nr:hypothetical protein CY0110_16932 [Crocosphaera chwakensis CCY0110]
MFIKKLKVKYDTIRHYYRSRCYQEW